MKVAILGTGAYGIALASVLHNNQNEVIMWSKFSTEIEELDKKRTSSKLPSYTIPVEISFTTNMKVLFVNLQLQIKIGMVPWSDKLPEIYKKLWYSQSYAQPTDETCKCVRYHFK